jgi:hypothetical protein
MTRTTRSSATTDAALREQRTGNEVDLTRSVFDLSCQDASLAPQITRMLLTAVRSAPDGVPNTRVPETPARVTLTREVDLGRVKETVLTKRGGKVDWKFSAAGFLLLVEVKINSTVGEHQLQRYLNAPAFKSKATAGGLILLTRDGHQVPKAVYRKRRWLGQLTWEQLLPELQTINPAVPEVARRWQELLLLVSQVSVPGIRAATPVGWTLNGRTAGHRNSLILKSVADSTCRTVDKALGARRGYAVTDGLCGYRRPGQRTFPYSGDQATLQFYVPATKARDWAVHVSLQGTRRPLKLTTTVQLPVKPLVRTKKYQAAVEGLAQAGFTFRDELAHVTDRVTSPGGADPQEAPATVVRALLAERTVQLVASGVLDTLR